MKIKVESLKKKKETQKRKWMKTTLEQEDWPKKKREMSEITKNRSERGAITADSTKVKGLSGGPRKTLHQQIDN